MFGLGCFWGAETDFWRFRGVLRHRGRLRGRVHAEPDLRGGLLRHDRPCRGRPRRVRPGQHELRRAAEGFFEGHDPTQRMRQGLDVGTQYRSAIYYLHGAQHEPRPAHATVYQRRSPARLRHPATEIAAGRPLLLRRGATTSSTSRRTRRATAAWEAPASCARSVSSAAGNPEDHDVGSSGAWNEARRLAVSPGRVACGTVSRLARDRCLGVDSSYVSDRTGLIFILPLVRGPRRCSRRVCRPPRRRWTRVTARATPS